jgi:transketolase
MPSWELFAEQSEDYRESVLPAALTRRLSVEAGVTLGWHRWVGDRGETIGTDRFGASAPGATLMKEFGFTAEHVVARALGML